MRIGTLKNKITACFAAAVMMLSGCGGGSAGLLKVTFNGTQLDFSKPFEDVIHDIVTSDFTALDALCLRTYDENAEYTDCDFMSFTDSDFKKMVFVSTVDQD